MTRRCLAEVLSEKIESGDLKEEFALKIGKQILRDNALKLFPQLNDRYGNTEANSNRQLRPATIPSELLTTMVASLGSATHLFSGPRADASRVRHGV